MIMVKTLTYYVPGMHCAHCKAALEEGIGMVVGVEDVDVDMDMKVVRVHGRELDDAALRAAIDEAGYEAE